MATCLECGASFTKAYAQQNCCSPECRAERQRRRKMLQARRLRKERRERKEAGPEPIQYGSKTRHRDAAFGLTAEERREMGLRPLDPGLRPCARCERTFHSWDRSRKVLCPLCTEDAEDYAPDAFGVMTWEVGE